jgi:hypothetical protein
VRGFAEFAIGQTIELPTEVEKQRFSGKTLNVFRGGASIDLALRSPDGFPIRRRHHE